MDSQTQTDSPDKIFSYSPKRIRLAKHKALLLGFMILLTNTGLSFSFESGEPQDLNTKLIFLASINAFFLFVVWITWTMHKLNLQTWKLRVLPDGLEKLHDGKLVDKVLFGDIKNVRVVNSVRDEILVIQLKTGRGIVNLNGFEGLNAIVSILQKSCGQGIPFAVKNYQYDWTGIPAAALGMGLVGGLFWLMQLSPHKAILRSLLDICVGLALLIFKPFRKYSNNSNAQMDIIIGALMLLSIFKLLPK